ncbi:protein DEK-like [Zingiber officinale]|uniref:protein DEK-like n=1 Tax=Zingiber officinale TaxID=94328 RepID=UPI001C4CDE0B|nr:protein DEK-like [Zingiber officinale]
MDSDSGVAAEEIKNAVGGSGAGDAEREVDEQKGEDGSPGGAGGDEEDKKVEEEGGDGAAEVAKGGKRKRGRGRIAREKSGEGEEEGTAKRKRRSVAKEAATPVERPSRERKRVERFAAMSPRKTSVPKTPSFEQGSGQKLKDIPNVSFKLSKRKADENLRALHSLLFGRKSTVHYLKRNILQFSGYVWSQNEEKQRIRVKEKLDKYNKERLLDFCDLLDIHAVKTTTKKEEIVSNLMEFLESPCITRDVILTEKKGKRGRQSKGTSGEIPSEKSTKKLRTSNQQSTADENGDNEENVAGDAKDEMHDGEDDGESQEESDHGKSEEEEEQDERAPTNKSSVAKRTKKNIAPSEEKSKVTPVKQMASGKRSSEDDLDVSSEDDPSSPPESKKDSNREMNEPERKVSAKEKRSRRNKSARGTKSTSTSSAKKSDSLDDSESEPPPDSKSKKVGRKGRTKEKTPSKKEATGKTKISKSESKETANKKRGKSKLSEAKKNEPSTEELHSVVSKILKEVDFNTATLADILRQLGAHFNTNLMDRNAEVKRIIEDVINNMTDEEDEEGAEDDAENDDDADDAKEDSDRDDQK